MRRLTFFFFGGGGGHATLQSIQAGVTEVPTFVKPLGLKFLCHWRIVPLTGLRTLCRILYAVLKPWCHMITSGFVRAIGKM